MERIQAQVADLKIGGGSRTVVQTMCNTHTSDVDASVEQCVRLQEAGAEVFVASGDRQEKLEAVAEFIGIPKNHVFGAATPERKHGI